jgi:hypothetical protein
VKNGGAISALSKFACKVKKVKVKISLFQAVKAHRVARG